MGREIERRFFVRAPAWREQVTRPVFIAQGYLASGTTTVRVRIAGNEAFITVKGPYGMGGFTRAEYEYPIPLDDARAMLETLCGSAVSKTRYALDINGLEFVIDEFDGDNQGLVLAEVELTDESQAVPVPEWMFEITQDRRFANSSLAARPWQSWTTTERDSFLKAVWHG